MGAAPTEGRYSGQPVLKFGYATALTASNGYFSLISGYYLKVFINSETALRVNSLTFAAFKLVSILYL